MPTTSATGVEIYYERSGSGPRLLFVNGSGATIDRVAALLGVLRPSFDLIAYDNRGLGESGPAAAPYTMADCAADALAVMDAAGWETARVLGVSFGGMVAQELAVTAPERVERLALLCTSPGGPGRSSYPLHEVAVLPPAERAAAMRSLLDTRFTDAWLAEHPSDRTMVDMLQAGQAETESAHRAGELAQLEARRGHDVWERLPAITCPTLVACGTYDAIAPPANSAAIVAQVPGAELRSYDGGHAFFAQDPRAFPDVIGFLLG